MASTDRKHVENTPAELSLKAKLAWTYAECAPLIGVSVSQLQHMVHRRQIPFVKRGKLVRFLPSEIEAWLEEGKVRVSRPRRMARSMARAGRKAPVEKVSKQS